MYLTFFRQFIILILKEKEEECELFNFFYGHTPLLAHKITIPLAYWLEFSPKAWETAFNPRSSNTKDSKMVLGASLLNTQYYKVRFKAKVEQSRERSSALPFTAA